MANRARVATDVERKHSANSVKLLNHVETEGENLRFYSELDADVEVGDKVFIIGGNYDNIGYSDTSSSLYNPYHKYAMGYRVLSVDNTNKTNGITLNIGYGEKTFTSAGVQSIILNKLPVYKTAEELTLAPNQLREAYLTKTYFKCGEFNGGKFSGIFGAFNIKGEASTAVYQRQEEVNALIEKYTAEGKSQEVAALLVADYTVYEAPALNNNATFNNKFTNTPAQFVNGVFLGGDWQWGTWVSKYSNQKVGKKQTIDETGNRTIAFANNNDKRGYNILVSGNIGRIYTRHSHNIIATTNSVTFDYLPYELIVAMRNGFSVQMRMFSTINTHILDVVSINEGEKRVFVATTSVYYGVTHTHPLTNHTEITADVEFYIKDANKPNNFTTGRFLSADWFGGKVKNGYVEGGDWHNGEFTGGVLSSSYQRLNWYNGHFDNALAQNVRWYNGQWYSGQWRGDSVVSILNFHIEDNLLRLSVATKFAHLFEVGKSVFISYIKKSLNNQYLENNTDLPNNRLLNYQDFELLRVVYNANDPLQVQLVLNGNIDSVTNINLVHAKVSASFFEKGTWFNGMWESGLRSVTPVDVTGSLMYQNNNQLVVRVTDSKAFELNDLCLLTNTVVSFNINGTVSPELNYTNKTYRKPLHAPLRVMALKRAPNLTVVTLEIPAESLTLSTDIAVTYAVTGVDMLESNNSYTVLTNAPWLAGDFRAGVWRGGVWKTGLMRNKLYFDLNNEQVQSVWQSGYWMGGEFNGGTFLSGVWENGTWQNGIMTNFFQNSASQHATKWNAGDSFWLNGEFNGGTWKGGVWKKGTMNAGTVINGGIEQMNWKSGVYDNGFGLYDNKLYANRSGKHLVDKKTYDLHSAPSLISIDGNGWVQLDQPSLYQKGYNVIFQDLNGSPNPFNNEMFKVLGRDEYGTRFQINYTSGDNPLYDLNEFSTKQPLLVGDYLGDVCEVEKTSLSHIFWVMDRGHQRILALDTITKTVDVLGKVLNNSRKNIYEFSDLRKLASTPSSAFVYAIDGDNVKRINKAASQFASQLERDIFVLSPPLKFNESIVDIWVNPSTSSVSEIVFIYTSNHSIYYIAIDSEVFNELSFQLATSAETIITYVKATGTNTVHALVRERTATDRLLHYVLEYNLPDKTYAYRSNNVKFVTEFPFSVNTIVAAFDTDSVLKIWLSNETDIYVLHYLDIIGGENNLIHLNANNKLESPIHTIRLGWNNEYLLVLSKDENMVPVYLSKASLGTTTTGLSNKNSPTKLLSIHQALDNTSQRKYYYYDTAFNPTIKRIVWVNPGLVNGYNPETDVDTLAADDEVIKMVNGSKETEVFSIIRKTRTNRTVIRRSVFHSTSPESNYYSFADVQDTEVVVHDMVFTRNTLFMAVTLKDATLGVVTRIVALSDFSQTIIDLSNSQTKTKYSTSNLNIMGGSGTILLDVIENRDGYLGILYKADQGIYQLVIENNAVNSKKVYDTVGGIQNVRDLTLTARGSIFSLFLATDTEIVKIITNGVFSENGAIFYRWTQLTKTSDVVFNSTNITDVYRNNNSSRLVIKAGSLFSTIEPDYQPNEVDINIDNAVVVNANTSYVLSNQSLVKITGTTLNTLNEKGIGIYKQQNSATQSEVLDATTALNNPFSLIHAPGFQAGNDYLFFVDTSTDIDYGVNAYKNFVRYYNLTTGECNIAAPISTIGNAVICDIHYNEATKEVFILKNTYSLGRINSTISKFSWGGGEIYNIQDVVTIEKQYKKFTLFQVGGSLHAAAVSVPAIAGENTKIDIIENVTVATDIDTRLHTIKTGVAIEDLAYTIRNTKLELYYISKSLLYVSSASLTDIFTAGGWSASGAIADYENVKSIVEVATIINGYGGGVLVNNGNQLAHIVADSTVNQQLSLQDFSLIRKGNNRYVYFYNASANTGYGVIRQSYDSGSTSIDVRLSSMVQNVSTGSYRKMVGITTSVAYVLLDDGLYKYNFNTNRSSIVTMDNVRVVYRDENEPSPTDINKYYYKIVDISRYEHIQNGEVIYDLLVLVAIYNGNTHTKCYDAFTYNGSSFSNASLRHLYGGENRLDAILNNGKVDSRYLPNALSITSDVFGGIRHLFKSTSEPQIVSTPTTISLEFTTNTVKKVLTVSKYTSNVDYFPNIDAPGSIGFRVELHTHDFDRNSVVGGVLVENGKVLAYSQSVSSTEFYVGEDDVLYDELHHIMITFPKTAATVAATNHEVQLFFNVAGASTHTEMRVLIDQTTDNLDYKIVRRGSSAIDTESDHLQYYELINNTLQSDKGKIYVISGAVSPTLYTKWDVTINSFVKNNNALTMLNSTLPVYNNNYFFTPINKFYRVKDDSSQALSPYVTSRVLYKTRINDGVIFNRNGSASSAHAVATTWKNDLFVGSWNAPHYADNAVITNTALFLSGTFEGVFYNGYFLGGKFKNGTSASSVIQGHFVSENNPINFQSGSVKSDYRYDVRKVWYSNEPENDTDDNNVDYLWFDVESLRMDASGNYAPALSNQLGKGWVVTIPTFFKERFFTILEVSKPQHNIYNENAVILKINKAAGITKDFFVDSIFLQSDKYTEHFFGNKQVLDVFDNENYIYIVIKSDFLEFDSTNRYVPEKLIINNSSYCTVAKSLLVDGVTQIAIKISLPNISDLPTRLRYIQNTYLNDSVQMMYTGNYQSHIQVADSLQLFTLSFTKTNHTVAVEFNTPAKHMFVKDVISIDLKSYVSVNLLGAATNFAKGICVSNSYITTPADRNQDWIEGSIFLSGKTDRNWKSGGWLNTDARGFSNASSSFGSDITTRFDGESVEIVDVFFETDEYVWVELSKPLITINKDDFISLRGFTGSKSVLIGAERSKLFRVLEIDGTFIKIHNPFKYYTGITSSTDYNKDFNKDYLQVRKQTALKKSSTNGIYTIHTPDVEQVFNYGIASTSCWNGGDFTGDFRAVWNAGTFVDGAFNGTWFGGNENNFWQGEITIATVATSDGFVSNIPVGDCNLLADDLVFVNIHDLVSQGERRRVVDGFYAVVVNENSELVIKKTTNQAIRNGVYGLSITRYRVGYEKTNSYLITDYNTTASSPSPIELNFVPSLIDVENITNKALSFNGADGIIVPDLIELSLINGVPGQFSMDAWFVYDDLVTPRTNPLFGFHDSTTDSKIGTTIQIRNNNLCLLYEDAMREKNEVILFDNVVASKWYHFGFFYSNGTFTATLYDQDFTSSFVYANSEIMPTFSKYDVCFIGKSIQRTGDVNNSTGLIGRMDEIRFWSQNVLSKFYDLSDPTTNRPATSLFNKRIVNKYMIELVAYYNAENALDTTSLYPEEENYITINKSTPMHVLTQNGIDVSVKGKNIIVNANVLFDNQISDYSQGAYRKVLVVQDVVDITQPSDTTKKTIKYSLELLISATAHDEYAIRLQERVNGNITNIIFDKIDDSYTFWQWKNLCLTSNALFLDGVLVESYVCKHRNVMMYATNAIVILGDATNAVTAYLKNVVVYQDQNTNDYVMYRIASGEGTARYTSGTTTTDINTALVSPDASYIVTPNIIDASVFASEGFMYDIRGKVDETTPVPTAKPNANALPNAFPSTGWLDGAGFTTAAFTSSSSILVPLGNMNKFTFFGRKFGNNVNIVINKAGFLTFSSDLKPAIDAMDNFDLHTNGRGVNLFESADTIQFLHTTANYTSNSDSSYIEYADRYNEFVLKFNFNTKTAAVRSADVYSYVALRIDKVSGNILFYNRMIRDDASAMKHQGVGRCDGLRVSIKTPTFSYSRNVNEPDFAVGYLGQNVDTRYAPNIEYVLYSPRTQSVPSQLVADHLKKGEFDTLLLLGVKKLIDFKPSSSIVPIVNVGDMPVALQPVYGTLTNLVAYDNQNFQTIVANSDQYSFNDTMDKVSRSSFFMGGLFNSSIWYTGVMLGGTITATDFMWKYGLKTGGSISNSSVYKRFVSDAFKLGLGVKYIYDKDASNNKAVYSTKCGVVANGVRVNLKAGSYKLICNLKSSLLVNKILGVLRVYVNSVQSGTLNGIDIISRLILSSDFALTNTYSKIELNFALPTAMNGVEFELKQTDQDGEQSFLGPNNTLIFDYIDLYEQSEYSVMKNPSCAHWFGGYHTGNESSVDGLLWYRGQWDGGVWKTGNWMALDHNNEYNDDVWSTWNAGVWRSDTVVQSDALNIYSPAVTGSTWHGGIWKSLNMPNQLYSYKNNKFTNYAVSNGNVLQLPYVNSTWLGGQWLRGQWDGGLFVNGNWHSASATPNNPLPTFEITHDTIPNGTTINKFLSCGDATYAICNGGKIFMRPSNGAGWVVQLTSVGNDLMSGVFLSDKVTGYVVGTSGKMLKTTNAGTTWSIVAWTMDTTFSTKKINDIVAVNDRCIFFCGDTLLVYTLDGGATWTPTTVANTTFTLISHNNNNKVYATAGNVINTFSIAPNNTQWVSETIAGFSDSIVSMSFVNDNIGYIFGANRAIAMTKNGGASWLLLSINNTSVQIQRGAFINSTSGYAFSNNLLHQTHDAGATWTNSTIDLTEYTAFLVNTDKLHMVIGGAFGRVCDIEATVPTVYEQSIGYLYNENASKWKKGMMLNSVWEGGVVEYSTDVLDTVFGDLVTQYSLINDSITNADFKWEKTYQLKRSDASTSFKRLFGRDFFTGYHNTSGIVIDTLAIEKQRVANQYNEDGIMSVYWKRGTWNNGLFQFSTWCNENLNQEDLSTIGSVGNFSTFQRGYFYSSLWKGGLWKNTPSSNSTPPLLVDSAEPHSLFYQSQWESGYWKSGDSSGIGLLTDDLNDDMRITDGMFLKSLWSAGVWEGGVFDSSVWRSGVNETRNISYKGETISLTTALDKADLSKAIDITKVVYPNFDVIGRLTNSGTLNTLINTRAAIAQQPTVVNNKRYVLNQNNTISVFNTLTSGSSTLRLDFQELYGEVFNTVGGSNNGANLPNNNVTALVQLGNVMWVGTATGLWKIDTLNKASVVQVANVPVQSLFATTNRIWVGNANGLWSMDVQTQIVTTYPGNVYTGRQLPSTITAIHGNDSILYVGTTTGLWILDLTTLYAKTITTTATDVVFDGSVLPSNIITSILRSSGRLWVGTTNGLWLLNLDTPQKPFAQLFHDSSNLDGFDYIAGSLLPSNNITTISQSGSVMWIGTIAGLWRMDTRN